MRSPLSVHLLPNDLPDPDFLDALTRRRETKDARPHGTTDARVLELAPARQRQRTAVRFDPGQRNARVRSGRA